MPAPDVSSCEVTYINHLEKGAGWHDFADLSNVLKCWSPCRAGDYLPPARAVTLEAFYEMLPEKGSLLVNLLPAIRSFDGKEILQLTLVARCQPHSSGLDDLLRCLDLGRQWIVRGFNDLTTDAMHNIWRKERKT